MIVWQSIVAKLSDTNIFRVVQGVNHVATTFANILCWAAASTLRRCRITPYLGGSVVATGSSTPPTCVES